MNNICKPSHKFQYIIVMAQEGVNIKVKKDVIDVEIKKFDQLMTTNPELRKRFREIIHDDLWKTRNAVVRNIQSIFLNGDPMEARRAIRNIVYQKLLGGNLNILTPRRGTANWKVTQKQRKVEQNPHMRGGNRRRRSRDTIRREGYEGKARGFILRFVDSGTKERNITFTSNPNRKVTKHNKHPNTGYRGAIAPRRFFEQAAKAGLDIMAEHVSMLIEQEIKKMMDSKQ